jgi:phosphohistidine phosphatase
LADHDRPLNRRGRETCRLLADHFRARRIQPDTVLCSTAERTRETLQRIEHGIGLTWPTRFLEPLYLGESEELLEELRRLPDRVEVALLIGHNPGLEELAGELAGAGDAAALEGLRRKFPTGGLCSLRFETSHWRDLGPGRGRLIEFVTPKELGG